VAEICRRHGISDATFYTWRSKYGGLEVSEARRLKALEEENRKLKKLCSASHLASSMPRLGRVCPTRRED
jgi:putative transposase